MPSKVRLYERFDGTHHFGVVFSGVYPQFSVYSYSLISMLSGLLLVSIMVRHCIRTIFRFRLGLLKLSVLPRDGTSPRFG